VQPPGKIVGNSFALVGAALAVKVDRNRFKTAAFLTTLLNLVLRHL
jgi:hypothetical protein